MRFRQLRIRLQTSDGPYGTAINFSDGLVVVRADNSMGKSSCVKSMLVALGMDATLTTSQTDIPLTPAVLTQLQGADDRPVDVLESEVFLEMENASRQCITVQRTLKGRRDNHLVTVHAGPILTDPKGSCPAEDYFVNRPGGASRDRGFHRFLATFIGWELPNVLSYDGKDIPLYVQCLFPYFVVEQTRGWSSVLPPVPTHLRVREPHKRAVEFILNLDARRIALRRQELMQERAVLESEWSALRRRADDLARQAGAEVSGLPTKPTGIWPPQATPFLSVQEAGRWTALQERVESERLTHDRLINQEIPKVQEAVTGVAQELAEAEHALRGREALLARLMDGLRMEQGEIETVDRRLRAIEEDIKRNQDVETLRTLGAERLPSVNAGTCPICHHPLQDSLVSLPAEQQVMSIGANIEFLKEQKKTYSLVGENARRVAAARQRQINAGRAEMTALRDSIRALRQTLIVDGRMPSIAAIRQRLQLEDSIRRGTEVVEAFGTMLVEFGNLAERWRGNSEGLSQLPQDDVTEADKDKLATWSKLFRSQLDQYGFQSLPIPQLGISPDDYRPEHDGFHLQTSISASDLIRIIWAYLHGMLEVSRNAPTNHPGFLLFDEPRQQSTRDISFGQLLKRASAASQWGQQVIFFTSEKMALLEDQLRDMPHQLTEFRGRILQKE